MRICIERSIIMTNRKSIYYDCIGTGTMEERFKAAAEAGFAAVEMPTMDAEECKKAQELFAKYRTPAELADASVEDIERIVKPCGLGHSKAKDISACMKMLCEKYDGKVPRDFEALLSLPGVGRKSANLIMGDVFGEPAIVTDTHCIRLVNRMGLVDGIKDPKKVEMELWKLIPPQEGSDFCHRLVYHGRAVCTARTAPFCEKCCLADLCKKHL